MIISNFTSEHIEQASLLAKRLYDEARTHVPALPDNIAIPAMDDLAENGFGVVATVDGRLIGYLCCMGPFGNAFGTTKARHVFSPLHANGVAREYGVDRAKVYALMYQAAGNKWAEAGASSHAVILYAHDMEAQRQFFLYGFGARTVDAIRQMDEIAVPPCSGFAFTELTTDELSKLLPLNLALREHFDKSPTFMRYEPRSHEETLRSISSGNARYFAAWEDEKLIAYIKTSAFGENFACEASDMQNICGAYCLPEFRR